MAKVLLFTALILSIVVPFRMYFKGERSKRRYKISLAVNALAFFGLMLGAGLVMFGGNALQRRRRDGSGCCQEPQQALAIWLPAFPSAFPAWAAVSP